MKKIILTLLTATLLTGCSSGVSQEEYDKQLVINESLESELALTKRRLHNLEESLSSQTETSHESDETIESENTEFDESESVASSTSTNTRPVLFSLRFGKLLNFYDNQEDNLTVIKAKIEPSATNKMTINQNYHNMEYFIKNRRGNEYDEIQYWAVADMVDGSESKVISFTISKTVIDAIYNDNIAATQMGDYVNDLWILPSLLN